jgi:hypothetical protein
VRGIAPEREGRLASGERCNHDGCLAFEHLKSSSVRMLMLRFGAIDTRRMAWLSRS